MIGRVVEVAEARRHLSKDRGFLTVSADQVEVGRVPLDSVVALIASGHGLTYSNALLAALADYGAPFVLCGSNYLPRAFLLPVDGHHEQAGRFADQAAAGKPLKKRLWAQLVRAKISAQAETLRAVGAGQTGFQILQRKVRSGDPENVEAQAARRYWPLLFGPEFRRNRDLEGVNSLLNYAYTVLRAGAARAIVAAGLHPSLGLAHRQRGNAFQLADDLMEPFRPMADLLVSNLVEEGAITVDAYTKPELAGILTLDMSTADGMTPVSSCLERASVSLARCYAGTARELDLAKPVPPLLG